MRNNKFNTNIDNKKTIYSHHVLLCDMIIIIDLFSEAR